MLDPQSQLIISVVVGYALAWLRAHKDFPDPLAYLCAAIVGAALYYLAIPEGTPIHWKVTAWQYVAFLFAARGMAGASSEVHAAPQPNSR